MTVYWGEWSKTGGNGMRLGVETYGGSAVTTSSTTYTFKMDAWTENQYNYSDPQTLNWGNALTGSLPYTNNQGSGTQTKRHTLTYTYTYPAGSYGTSPATVKTEFNVSDTYNGSHPTQYSQIAVPARPYAAPTAPSVLTATRNSDAQATVNWTLSATAQKPVTSVTVQMRTYTGSTWGAYATVATLSGAPTSYVKTGLSANRIYQFQVRTNNSVGSSSYVTASAATVKMTPGAPTGAVAALQDANQIKVDWTNTSYIDSGVTWTIQRSVAGGAFANVATGLAQGTTTWTDPAAGAGTNQYQVKAVQATGPLSSAYALSNTVSTIVPPLAPTNLAPNGVTIDLAALGVTMTWKHNHGGDGAAQTQYNLAYSTDGGATWGGWTSANSAASRVIPPGTFANGTAVQFKVRTQGIASAGWGPYSAVSTVTGATAPAVSLAAPPEVLNTLPLVVSWDYSQAEGHPQTQWEATLHSGDGTLLLESLSGSDNAGTATFTYPVQDQTAYLVGVRAKSSDGVWSEWASTDTSIDLLPPAGVALTGEYDECTGTVALTLAPLEAEPDVTEPNSSVDLYRAIDGGAQVRIATGLVLTEETVLLDTIPSTTGVNDYWTVAYASSGSAAVGAPVSVVGTDGVQGRGLWVFVSYGPGFSSVLRFSGDPVVTASVDRERGTATFFGRRLPVLLLGEHRTRSLGVSGSLDHRALCDHAEPSECRHDSSRDEWEALAWEADVVCFRDWTGRRTFGRLGAVTTGDLPVLGMSTVAFSVDQVDWDEERGGLPPSIDEGAALSAGARVLSPRDF